MSWIDMSPTEASRTTMREFSYYAESHRLKEEQKTKDIALQSWINQSAKATNEKGDKSAYKNFQDFYDKSFNDDKNGDNEKMSIAERNWRLNQKKGGK